jgi:predicted kinase
MDGMQPTLYIMLGYPGAGKTTAAKVIHQLTGAMHLWADHERRQMFGQPTYTHAENMQLYDALNKRVEQLLHEGKSLIFDTNFNFFRDRQRMRQIAADAGAQCKLIWVTTPKDIAKQRAISGAIQQDTRILGDMPPEAFERMSRNLEPPTNDEQFIEVDGTKVSPEYIADLLGL